VNVERLLKWTILSTTNGIVHTVSVFIGSWLRINQRINNMPWDDEFEFFDSFKCPVCGTDECVPPMGAESSPLMIIGAYPGKDEIVRGRPMEGSSGGVLKAELSKVGLDWKQIRVGNLWIHEPNNNEDCFTYGAEQIIKDAKDKKLILLIGSDTVKYFCDGASVERNNGLLVTSKYLTKPKLMACIQPTTVFHGGLGEFRLTIQKFAKEVEKWIE